MSSAALTDPMFTDENAAREVLESVRWPNGPVCVHCGCTEHVVRVAGEKQSHRAGLLYCNDCKGQFTVTVGTVFERSKIPLTKWWMATFLLCSSKKGISSHQISRTLGVQDRMVHDAPNTRGHEGRLAGPDRRRRQNG
jgi:transposase-like protein